MDGITPLNFVGAAKKFVQQPPPAPQVPPAQPQGQQPVGWQNHQNRSNQNRRRPSALVYGNGKHGSNDSNQFICSADVNLVASGVSKDATVEQLKEFIVARGINVTDIELLTNHFKEESRSFTYRIAIKAEDYEKALKPDVWPYRVGVRPYKAKRSQQQQNSWQYQSGHAGGNMRMEETGQKNFQPAGNVAPKRTETTEAQGAQGLDLSNRYVANGFSSKVFN